MGNEKLTGEEHQEIKRKNQENKMALLSKLGIVNYFNMGKIKIQLFFPDDNNKDITGNDFFKQQAKEDLSEIRKAEKENKEIKYPWRTNGMSIDNIQEAGIDEFEKLLNEKFNEAVVYNGYKTIDNFAKDEALKLEQEYATYIDWFPIMKQWINFLKENDKLKAEGNSKNKVQTTTFTVAQIALSIYYADESKEARITTPKKTFWENKNLETGLSAKKIELGYNLYNNPNSGESERIKASNIENLKIVINILQKAGHSKALSLAKDDLTNAELNHNPVT